MLDIKVQQHGTANAPTPTLHSPEASVYSLFFYAFLSSDHTVFGENSQHLSVLSHILRKLLNIVKQFYVLLHTDLEISFHLVEKRMKEGSQI